MSGDDIFIGDQPGIQLDFLHSNSVSYKSSAKEFLLPPLLCGLS